MHRSALAALALGCLWVSHGLSADAAAMPQESQQASQDTQQDNCVACHGALRDERLSAPVGKFPADVHAARGLTCASCHGGDATASGFAGMDEAKGFLAKPAPGAVPQFCGRCHSDAEFMRRYNPAIRVDQVTEYAASVHGRRLLELADTNVATCVSCHPAHSIRPPTDPLSSVHPLNVAETCSGCHADAERMDAYRIPTDQRQRYERSVHWEALSVGGDLSAPTCNDCHGNHGAAPPGVSWVGNVCGQCHSVMADFFQQSRHATTFALLGVPGCAACHQNHDIAPAGDELLGLDDGAVCTGCHTPGDRGGEAAGAMRSLIDSLRARFDQADSLLLRAEHAGMEVSQARFELGGARNALISARAAVHLFDVVGVRNAVEEGLAITAEANLHGEEALDELQFRRIGLVVSVTIIVALIVGLVLKIREVERKQAKT
ncbi:MAG: hypothetical protein GTN62_01040 [Gemmatimonadales bacterium]|nr:hypothetical protein [Gemmatimonadales bacterium]NIN48689.1 hypothetical protein [Gemmatimonadales bacterium]NIP06153.1 hypothetical protein [Gemmatimonadales bacterium]NIR01327.1 hypothetical protein [Gemmatimonadales bacterium]